MGLEDDGAGNADTGPDEDMPDLDTLVKDSSSSKPSHGASKKSSLHADASLSAEHLDELMKGIDGDDAADVELTDTDLRDEDLLGEMRELGWDGTADEEEPSPPKPACPGTAPKLAASAVTASTSASASSTASTPVVSSPPQAQASVSTPGGRLHSPVAPPPPPPPAAGRTTAPTPHSLVAQLQLQASQLRNEAMRLRNTGRRPDAIAVLKQLTTVKAQLDQLEQQQRGTVEAPLATSVETTPPAPAKSPTALSLALSAASSITPATTPARPTPPSPPVTPRARTTPPPPATPPQPEAGPAASPAWTKETLLAAYLAATREATANHRMAVARRLLTVAKQIKAQPWDPEHVPPPPTEVAAAAEAEEAGAAASPTAAATTPAPAPASSTTAGRTQSPVSRVSASAASASSSATVADVTPADAPPPGASDLAVSQGLLGQLEKQSAEIEGWLRQCQASGDATTAGALQEALAQDRAAIGIIKAWMAVAGGRMPPYQLLPRTVAVERTFPDIAENEMEVEIAQGHALTPSATSNLYFKVEFNYPQDNAQKATTPAFSSPGGGLVALGHRLRLTIERRDGFRRTLARKRLTFELLEKRLLLKDRFLGRTAATLEGLATRAETTLALALTDTAGKPTSGRLTVTLRARRALNARHIVNFTWTAVVFAGMAAPPPPPVATLPTAASARPAAAAATTSRAGRTGPATRAGAVRQTGGAKPAGRVAPLEEQLEEEEQFFPVDAIVSNAVLEAAQKELAELIERCRQGGREPPDALVTRKQQMDLRETILIAEVQAGTVTPPIYMQRLGAAIEKERKLAVSLSAANRRQAVRALKRAKLMEAEVADIKKALENPEQGE